MQMDIQSQGFTLTDSLSDYLKKRLAYALNHGDEYISRVTVRLSDINGPQIRKVWIGPIKTTCNQALCLRRHAILFNTKKSIRPFFLMDCLGQPKFNPRRGEYP